MKIEAYGLKCTKKAGPILTLAFISISLIRFTPGSTVYHTIPFKTNLLLHQRALGPSPAPFALPPADFSDQRGKVLCSERMT